MRTKMVAYDGHPYYVVRIENCAWDCEHPRTGNCSKRRLILENPLTRFQFPKCESFTEPLLIESEEKKS